MRHRYFSPQLRYTLPQQRSSNISKLRWMGSNAQLPTSFVSDDAEQQIGPYTYFTNKELGSGYSSKVYKAIKKDSNQQFAIKVIELKKYSNSNMQMLANQIQIIKKLEHPNIIRCYDVYKTSSKCFIVMEYCPYGDLLGYLSKKGKLSESQSTQIIQQVIQGCKYLIKKHIIHRDIKPANIIKGKHNWKIADFGFAIQSQTQLKSKYNVGTPLYMPPQSLINNIYSIKSDIFSVGILLYELLTGCTPWQSRTEKDLIRKMTNLPFKIPEKYNISKNMRSFLKNLCKINFKDRMGKEEFTAINLVEMKENPKMIYFSEQVCLKKSLEMNIKKVQSIKQRATSSQQIGSKKLKTLQSQSTNENQQDDQFLMKKTETKNNHILINQLHFCRFLYYMIKNNQSFLICKKSNHRLNLVLFKHITKLMKKLSDSKNNWLKLQNWKQFKRSRKYSNTILTLKEYSSRYEKQYTSYLKHIQVPLIKEINKEFPQLSTDDQFTIEYYHKLSAFISPIIREANHNLGVLLSKTDPDPSLTKQHVGNIEALMSLSKLHKLNQLNATQFENYSYFQRHSEIKVHVDYQKVSNHSINTFIQLRNELKTI